MGDMKQEKAVEVIEEVIGWGMPLDRTIQVGETVGFFMVGDEADVIGDRRTKKNSVDNDSDVCESPTNGAEDSVSTDEGIVATDDEDSAVTKLKKVFVRSGSVE